MQKAVAVVVLLSFTFTSVVWSAPISNPITEVSIKSAVRDLDIPESLGLVKDRYITSGPNIFHLQDAHSSAEAQKSIRGIIHHIAKDYKIDALFMEGAIGRLDPDFLRYYSSDELNQEFAGKLTDAGLVDGAELYLLDISKKGKAPKIVAHGIEDAKLYHETLEAYRAVYKNRHFSNRFLEQLKLEITSKASQLFNKKLGTFFRDWLFYQDVPNQILSHLNTLKSYAKSELNIDLNDAREQLDWPQLVRLFKVRELESQVDRNKSQEEFSQLEKWLQENKIEKKFAEEFEHWAARHNLGVILSEAKNPERDPSAAPQDDKIHDRNLRSFLEQFYDAASKKGFSYQNYPALSKSLGLSILQEELDASALFEEIELITDKILDRLASKDEEKALVNLYKDYVLLRNLLTLELTEAEYSKIQMAGERLNPFMFINRVERVKSPKRTTGLKKWKAKNSELSVLFKKSIKFYDLAVSREQIMFDNIVRMTKESRAHNILLVTGGFHGKGLHKLFRNAGISYAEILPHMSEISDSDKYSKIMMMEPSQLAKRSHANNPAFTDALLEQGVRIYYGDEAGQIKKDFEAAKGSLSQHASVVVNEGPVAQSILTSTLRAKVGVPDRSLGAQLEPSQLARAEMRTKVADKIVAKLLIVKPREQWTRPEVIEAVSREMDRRKIIDIKNRRKIAERVVEKMTRAETRAMGRRDFLSSVIAAAVGSAARVSAQEAAEEGVNIPANPLFESEAIRETYQDTLSGLIKLRLNNMPINQTNGPSVPTGGWIKSADPGFMLIADLLAGVYRKQAPIGEEGKDSSPRAVVSRIKRSLKVLERMVNEFGLRNEKRVNTGIIPEILVHQGNFFRREDKNGKVAYASFDWMLTVSRLKILLAAAKGEVVPGLNHPDVTGPIERILKLVDFSPFIDDRGRLHRQIFVDRAGKITLDPGLVDNQHTESREFLFMTELHETWKAMNFSWRTKIPAGSILPIGNGDSGLTAFTEYEAAQFLPLIKLAPNSIGVSNRNYVTNGLEVASENGHTIAFSAPGTGRTPNEYHQFGLVRPDVIVPVGPALALTAGEAKAIENFERMVQKAKANRSYMEGFGLPDALDPVTGRAFSRKIIYMNNALVAEGIGHRVLRGAARHMPEYESIVATLTEFDEKHPAPEVKVKPSTKKAKSAKQAKASEKAKRKIWEDLYKKVPKRGKDGEEAMKEFIRQFLAGRYEKSYEVKQEGWLSGLVPFYSSKNPNRPYSDLENELNEDELERLIGKGFLQEKSRAETRVTDEIPGYVSGELVKTFIEQAPLGNQEYLKSAARLSANDHKKRALELMLAVALGSLSIGFVVGIWIGRFFFPRKPDADQKQADKIEDVRPAEANPQQPIIIPLGKDKLNIELQDESKPRRSEARTQIDHLPEEIVRALQEDAHFQMLTHADAYTLANLSAEDISGQAYDISKYVKQFAETKILKAGVTNPYVQADIVNQVTLMSRSETRSGDFIQLFRARYDAILNKYIETKQNGDDRYAAIQNLANGEVSQAIPVPEGLMDIEGNRVYIKVPQVPAGITPVFYDSDTGELYVYATYGSEDNLTSAFLPAYSKDRAPRELTKDSPLYQKLIEGTIVFLAPKGLKYEAVTKSGKTHLALSRSEARATEEESKMLQEVLRLSSARSLQFASRLMERESPSNALEKTERQKIGDRIGVIQKNRNLIYGQLNRLRNNWLWALIYWKEIENLTAQYKKLDAQVYELTQELKKFPSPYVSRERKSIGLELEPLEDRTVMTTPTNLLDQLGTGITDRADRSVIVGLQEEPKEPTDRTNVSLIARSGAETTLTAGTTGLSASVVDGLLSGSTDITHPTQPTIQTLSLYLSPNGNNTNSGSIGQPIQSIPRAQEMVRALRDKMLSGVIPAADINVYLLGGRYEIPLTLHFDERDSGVNGHRVIYQAAPGEEVVLSGGTQITNWTALGNDVFKANVGGLEFRQLYVNGEPATLARYRNDGSYSQIAAWDTIGQRIKVSKADLPSDLNSLPGVEMEILRHWSMDRVRIQSYSVEGNFVWITPVASDQHDLFEAGWPQYETGMRFRLLNSDKFLDEVGEFYRNSNGELFYKARPGQNMAEVTVFAPMQETLLRVWGSSLDKLVTGLEFRGITFEHTTWNKQGYSGVQAGSYYKDNVLGRAWPQPPAAVEVQNASGVIFAGNVFQNLGGQGIALKTGTNGIQIVGNAFADIASNAITVGSFNEAEANPADSRLTPTNHLIANNFITKIGKDYLGSVGIFVGYANHIIIEYNSITDLPYTAISVGAGWTDQLTVLRNNIIRFNEIWDVMKVLEDGGGIYILSAQPGTVVEGNFIHDIIRNLFTSYSPVAYIYLDNGGKYILVINNGFDAAPAGTRHIYEQTGGIPASDNTFVNNHPTNRGVRGAGMQPAFFEIIAKIADRLPEKPVVGDFDGNGTPDLGVVQGNRLTYQNISGGSVQVVPLGQIGEVVAGDLDHDGKTELIVFRNGEFHLENGTIITFGLAGDKPLIVNINGKDVVGVSRPNGTGGLVFSIDTNGSGVWDNEDSAIYFGLAGDSPLSVNGNIGVSRPNGTGGLEFFIDSNGSGVWNTSDQAFNFGLAGDRPVTGDWNGDGIVDIGVYRPIEDAFFIDFNGNGTWDVADKMFVLDKINSAVQKSAPAAEPVGSVASVDTAFELGLEGVLGEAAQLAEGIVPTSSSQEAIQKAIDQTVEQFSVVDQILEAAATAGPVSAAASSSASLFFSIQESVAPAPKSAEESVFYAMPKISGEFKRVVSLVGIDQHQYGFIITSHGIGTPQGTLITYATAMFDLTDDMDDDVELVGVGLHSTRDGVGNHIHDSMRFTYTTDTRTLSGEVGTPLNIKAGIPLTSSETLSYEVVRENGNNVLVITNSFNGYVYKFNYGQETIKKVPILSLGGFFVAELTDGQKDRVEVVFQNLSSNPKFITTLPTRFSFDTEKVIRAETFDAEGIFQVVMQKNPSTILTAVFSSANLSPNQLITQSTVTQEDQIETVAAPHNTNFTFTIITNAKGDKTLKLNNIANGETSEIITILNRYNTGITVKNLEVNANGRVALISASQGTIYSNIFSTHIFDIEKKQIIASIYGEPELFKDPQLPKYHFFDEGKVIAMNVAQSPIQHSYYENNEGVLIDTAGPNVLVARIQPADGRNLEVIDMDSVRVSPEFIDFESQGRQMRFIRATGEIVSNDQLEKLRAEKLAEANQLITEANQKIAELNIKFDEGQAALRTQTLAFEKSISEQQTALTQSMNQMKDQLQSPLLSEDLKKELNEFLAKAEKFLSELDSKEAAYLQALRDVVNNIGDERQFVQVYLTELKDYKRKISKAKSIDELNALVKPVLKEVAPPSNPEDLNPLPALNQLVSEASPLVTKVSNALSKREKAFANLGDLSAVKVVSVLKEILDNMGKAVNATTKRLDLDREGEPGFGVINPTDFGITLNVANQMMSVQEKRRMRAFFIMTNNKFVLTREAADQWIKLVIAAIGAKVGDANYSVLKDYDESGLITPTDAGGFINTAALFLQSFVVLTSPFNDSQLKGYADGTFEVVTGTGLVLTSDNTVATVSQTSVITQADLPTTAPLARQAVTDDGKHVIAFAAQPNGHSEEAFVFNIGSREWIARGVKNIAPGLKVLYQEGIDFHYDPATDVLSATTASDGTLSLQMVPRSVIPEGEGWVLSPDISKQDDGTVKAQFFRFIPEANYQYTSVDFNPATDEIVTPPTSVTRDQLIKRLITSSDTYTVNPDGSMTIEGETYSVYTTDSRGNWGVVAIPDNETLPIFRLAVGAGVPTVLDRNVEAGKLLIGRTLNSIYVYDTNNTTPDIEPYSVMPAFIEATNLPLDESGHLIEISQISTANVESKQGILTLKNGKVYTFTIDGVNGVAEEAVPPAPKPAASRIVPQNIIKINGLDGTKYEINQDLGTVDTLTKSGVKGHYTNVVVLPSENNDSNEKIVNGVKLEKIVEFAKEGQRLTVWGKSPNIVRVNSQNSVTFLNQAAAVALVYSQNAVKAYKIQIVPSGKQAEKRAQENKLKVITSFLSPNGVKMTVFGEEIPSDRLVSLRRMKSPQGLRGLRNPRKFFESDETVKEALESLKRLSKEVGDDAAKEREAIKKLLKRSEVRQIDVLSTALAQLQVQEIPNVRKIANDEARDAKRIEALLAQFAGKASSGRAVLHTSREVAAATVNPEYQVERALYEALIKIIARSIQNEAEKFGAVIGQEDFVKQMEQGLQLIQHMSKKYLPKEGLGYVVRDTTGYSAKQNAVLRAALLLIAKGAQRNEQGEVQKTEVLTGSPEQLQALKNLVLNRKNNLPSGFSKAILFAIERGLAKDTNAFAATVERQMAEEAKSSSPSSIISSATLEQAQSLGNLQGRIIERIENSADINKLDLSTADKIVDAAVADAFDQLLLASLIREIKPELLKNQPDRVAELIRVRYARLGIDVTINGNRFSYSYEAISRLVTQNKAELAREMAA